jgi:hypothetical protein
MMEPQANEVSIERTFNHDLLLSEPDRTAAADRWPALASILLNTELARTFTAHEHKAKRYKGMLQRLGSASVLLMLGALLGYVAELWFTTDTEDHIAYLGEASEISALSALALALLASRYGPVRRRWLKHRFVTEVLRQWHFRRLLDVDMLERAKDGSGQPLTPRNQELSALVHDLAGSVGEKMDALSEFRRDPLGPVPRARLPEAPHVRAQLLDAYRALRLDHQRDFAIYKLSTEDRTFAGLSLSALSTFTDQLAGTTLILALAFSVARLVVVFAWSPMAAVSLAITGVAVRAWRDGLALESERERYHEMLHVLELLTVRWESAESEEQRFLIAEEVERAGVEELRFFIRSHERAQFLF